MQTAFVYYIDSYGIITPKLINVSEYIVIKIPLKRDKKRCLAHNSKLHCPSYIIIDYVEPQSWKLLHELEPEAKLDSIDLLYKYCIECYCILIMCIMHCHNLHFFTTWNINMCPEYYVYAKHCMFSATSDDMVILPGVAVLIYGWPVISEN